MAAYLSDGELISDHETLTRLAGEVGLPDDEVAQTLASERYADEVRDDERTAGSLGISAVPFFVVDRAMGASGAHPPEALLDLLRQGWAARSPVATVAEGDSCGIDGC
jgi:predicted DsbA family dithiol-disulfide isomerase